MARRTTKHDVYDFVVKGDSEGILTSLTAFKVAQAFMKANPNVDKSIYTIEKYVIHTRAGKLEPYVESDLDSIVDRMYENSELAYETFKPKDSRVDLDPLGVLDVQREMVEIPESYTDYQPPFKMDGFGKRMGVISDIHLPVHDRPALIATHAHLKRANIDVLLILGDLMDSSNLSRHPQSHALRYTWKEELEVGRAYVKSLRVMFPNIPIIMSGGNHDMWLQRFLLRSAQQLEGDYLLQERLKLDEHDIKWISDLRLLTYGELYLHHGHIFGVSGGRHVATRLLDKFGVNLLVGHFHRQMTDSKTTLDGKTHACWVNGCLSDLHPSYNPYGNQTHGFSIVDLHEGGLFTVNQYRVINGNVIG